MRFSALRKSKGDNREKRPPTFTRLYINTPSLTHQTKIGLDCPLSLY